MHYQKNKLGPAVALALAAFALPLTASATNGYFSDGNGVRSRGMGGAGVALPEDSFAAVTNPAGMAMVGSRFDAGVGVFNPKRSYEVSGSPSFDSAQTSDSNYFLIPSLGYNQMVTSDDALGVTVYGNGGMNTNYASSPLGSGRLGVDLSQAFLVGTYAHRFGDTAAVGVSAIYAYQRFKIQGVQMFDNSTSSVAPGYVTNNGYDHTGGGGFKVGGLMNVGAGVSVGAAYQSKIDGRFDKYKGLFADGGEFDIPSNYTVGLAWKGAPNLAVALDYERINYSDSKAVSNPIENYSQYGHLLGSSNGPGFGWQDISVYKLGVQYATSEQWTWRAGWNHGQNPVPSSQVFFNILAPGIVTDHLTLGFTNHVSKTSAVSMDFVHAFKKTLTGNIPAAFGGGQTTLSLEENFVEVSYGMKL